MVVMQIHVHCPERGSCGVDLFSACLRHRAGRLSWFCICSLLGICWLDGLRDELEIQLMAMMRAS